MRLRSIAGAAGSLLLLTTAAAAQDRPLDPANPTTSQAARYVLGMSRNLVGAAELMPADKYGFKPTPAQWTFGEVVAHITDENDQSCDPILGRATHPKEPAASEGKAVLIAALRASFARCDTAFAGLKDSRLNDKVSYYGSQSPIVTVLFGQVSDWGDHYAQEAIYLRLNGILPPTARQN